MTDQEAADIDRQAVIIARAMLGQMPADGGSPLLLITAFINAAGNLFVMMDPPPVPILENRNNIWVRCFTGGLQDAGMAS